MLLIVGLGNPGRRYAGNRHNIGFMAADEIHRRHGFSPWRARFEGEMSEGQLGGEKAVILKPATYMNESGRAVGQAMRFFKLSPADVVVIYDELDLPPGRMRLKTGGGNAGNKGLKSIEAHVGKEFRRLRLGIGHPGAKELVNSYVLHDFAKADREWLEPLIAAIAENTPLLAKGNDANFMNRVHLATSRAEESEIQANAETTARGEAEGSSPPQTKHASEVAKRGLGGAFAGLRKLFGHERQR
jgi:PTH1 family peptidyl-tRNA hydrolase